MTALAAALAAARERIPSAEARLLLGHTLQRPLSWLIAHDDATLTESELGRFAMLVARRGEGEPIAYLTGQREFHGRRYTIASGVLIPRPETELLVEIACAKVRLGGTAARSVRVLDLGTGSGCVAISIALECKDAIVTAVDISGDALDQARANASTLGASIEFIHGDWFDDLPGRQFDLIVANPPYIAARDPHLFQGDLRFEPLLALASGEDGLDAIRRITHDARDFLVPGGGLFLEHGYDQAERVASLLDAAGFDAIEQRRDLAGIIRVSGGVRR